MLFVCLMVPQTGLKTFTEFDFSHSLKGPKHDQVEGEFFYIKQTRMVR